MNLVLAYIVVTAIGILLWTFGYYGMTSIFKGAVLKGVSGLIGLTGFIVTFFGWFATMVESINQFVMYMK